MPFESSNCSNREVILNQYVTVNKYRYKLQIICNGSVYQTVETE